MTTGRHLTLVTAIVASFALLVAPGRSQRPSPPAVDEKLPLPPPGQPVAFSHKTHVANGLQCTNCHTMSGEGFSAGIPKESTCMGCHVTIKKDSQEIQKIAAAAKAKTPIEWARIYRVPDYVWFSHASHVKDAKLGCENCHGPVAEREVMFKEKPTNMHSCMTCHAKHKASNGCDFCHATQ